MKAARTARSRQTCRKGEGNDRRENPEATPFLGILQGK
jgi:hypothetical protein